MSKYNVGDEFKIVIDEVFKGKESGNDKYRIKGFDNLVFDDKGLGKLLYIEKQYYAFVYTVRFENNVWTGAKYSHSVAIHGNSKKDSWFYIDWGNSHIGACVVIPATSRLDADRMLKEGIESRNKEMAGEKEKTT